MLQGPSFSPAFVFSINSLILSGSPFTSFLLAEAALYSCECSCPKILRNYVLFIIIHIFSTHFAINLFFGGFLA